MKEYYDRRAVEYDATSYELMRASADAPDLERVEAFLAGLPPGRILEVFKRYFTADRLAAELGGSIALETASLVAANVLRERTQPCESVVVGRQRLVDREEKR